MNLLFLDTYYVNGEESLFSYYNLLKDIIIPCLCGILLPWIIASLTIGRERYEKKLQEFFLREAIYFKLLSILNNNEIAISRLRANLNDLSFDNPIIVQAFVPSVHAKEYSSLNFVQLVNTFHKELNENSNNFRNNLDDLTNSIDFIIEMPNHYNFFVQTYLEQVIDSNNNIYTLNNKISDFVINKKNDPGFTSAPSSDYWNSIDMALNNLIRIHSNLLNSIGLESFKQIKDIVINPIDSTFIDFEFRVMIFQMINEFENIKSSSDQCIDQLTDYINSYTEANVSIRNIIENIRTNPPKILKYYLLPFVK